MQPYLPFDSIYNYSNLCTLTPIEDGPKPAIFLTNREWKSLETILNASEKQVYSSTKDINIIYALRHVFEKKEIFNICFNKVIDPKKFSYLSKTARKQPLKFGEINGFIVKTYMDKIWGTTAWEGKPTLDACCDCLDEPKKTLLKKYLTGDNYYKASTKKSKIGDPVLTYNSFQIDLYASSGTKPLITDAASTPHNPFPESPYIQLNIEQPNYFEDTLQLNLADEEREQGKLECQNSSEVLNELKHIEDILFPDGLPNEEEFLKFLNEDN